jgi:hypothetical protein
MSPADFQPVRRDSVPGGPVRVRPVGVILAAILLGLLGCLGLFSSFSMLAVAMFGRSGQMGPLPPGAVGVELVMGVFLLLTSALCVLVAIGLFQVKRWARVGTLVLSGLMVVSLGLSAIGCVAFAFSSPLMNSPAAANAPITPEMMRSAFLVMGFIFLVLALVGVWWLVYFNRKSVRDLFATEGLVTAPEHDGNIADSDLRPAVRHRSLTEILLICLGIVYLLGALNGPVVAAVHLPLFFFGMIFRGVTAASLAVAFSLLSALVGVGLLRRMKLAWFGAVIFQVVGVLSGVMLFLPSTRAAMAVYQQELQQRMSAWMPASAGAGNQFAQSQASLLSSAVFALVIGGGILWFLLRARPLFEK